MTEEQKDRLRTYAWNYFAFHAEQRMKTFHFYLIVIAALIAGFVTAGSRISSEHIAWLSLLGYLATFFSVTFAFIDKRNRILIRKGENAIKWLDKQEGFSESDGGSPHVISIFSLDDHENEAAPEFPHIEAHVSFTGILRVIFWAVGLLGFLSGSLCILIQMCGK